MAWVPAAVGGGFELLGGSIASSSNKAAQKRQNKFTEHMFDRQTAYATEMSNTEVRRRVEDLKAAGLNPMLAYHGSASSPSVSASNQGSGERMEAPFKGASSAAMAAYLARAQKTAIELSSEKTKAETDLTNQTARKTAAEATVTEATVPFSAFTAEMTATKLSAEVSKLVNEVKSALHGANIKSLEERQLRDLQPLILQMHQLELQAMRLGIPLMQNLSEAQKSWWMKNVSPYLPDILKSTGAAAGVKGVLPK